MWEGVREALCSTQLLQHRTGIFVPSNKITPYKLNKSCACSMNIGCGGQKFLFLFVSCYFWLKAGAVQEGWDNWGQSNPERSGLIQMDLDIEIGGEMWELQVVNLLAACFPGCSLGEKSF